MHDLLGSILFRTGRYEEAEAAFRTSVELAPDSVVGHRNLAAVLIQAGRFPEASAALQKSLEVAPDLSTYSNLGTLLFYQGFYRRSAAAFEKALELPGGASRPIVWGNLGDARRFAGGRPEQAVKAYRNAVLLLEQELRKAPGDPERESRVPVLVRGESGTGKELVARALHQASPRRDAPYIALNMASIPESLAAAELFGAVKGAYTGADRPRQGYFRRAAGGTLFLDEIGETPPEVQVQLLRALETGEIQPVGSEEARVVDVRVVSATDADLETAAREARFRAPLLHRLSGFVLRLPRLAERREDFGRLLVHFLRQELEAVDAVHRLGPARRPWLPAPLAATLARYDWPGNVRQLRNVVRQLVITHRDVEQVVMGGSVEALLAQHSAMDPAPQELPAPAGAPSQRKPAEVSEEELVAALREQRFELQATAAALGISRPSLYNLIAKSSRIRTAADLDGEEIVACHERHGGDPTAMAAELEVSEKALRRRLARLYPNISRSPHQLP